MRAAPPTVFSAEIQNYFDEISWDVEAACYGSYFLEFADYYSRENVDETQMLKLLLYQTLRALLKPCDPQPAGAPHVRAKCMVINGEYSPEPPANVSDSAAYAWEYVVLSPVERVYTFSLTDQVLREFSTWWRTRRPAT